MSEIISPCGADCFLCEKYPKSCAGCLNIKGKVWWTEFTKENICGIYECCVSKNNFDNCGKCKKFPCALFNDKDPTKTDEENAEIFEKQVLALRGK